MKRTAIFAAMAVCVAAWALSAAPGAEIRLTVTSAAAGSDVPVSTKVTLPADLADTPPEQIAVTMTPADGAPVPGQIVRQADGEARLWWIAPAVEAGKQAKWTARLEKGKPAEGFGWKDEKGKHRDLLCAGKRITRYMYERDTSDKRRAFDTAKVYHHVFNAEGTDTITKGPGGQFPHHRGIFLGFLVGYDGKKRDDWWHVQKVSQEDRKLLRGAAGPVLGAETVLIHWLDREGKPVVLEERETIVFRQPASTLLLLESRSLLKPARGDVELGGDPEHAGMQFRPHNDVNRKTTKYLFPREEVNRGNVAKELDLPWAALCYELKGKKYSVHHMNHPENPKGTRYSAYRDYGRFGAYSKAKIKQGESLTLKYRIWAAGGEFPSRKDLQARWEAFAKPPRVDLAK